MTIGVSLISAITGSVETDLLNSAFPRLSIKPRKISTFSSVIATESPQINFDKFFNAPGSISSIKYSSVDGSLSREVARQGETNAP
jgi:hypothetical protein